MATVSSRFLPCAPHWTSAVPLAAVSFPFFSACDCSKGPGFIANSSLWLWRPEPLDFHGVSGRRITASSLSERSRQSFEVGYTARVLPALSNDGRREWAPVCIQHFALIHESRRRGRIQLDEAEQDIKGSIWAGLCRARNELSVSDLNQQQVCNLNAENSFRAEQAALLTQQAGHCRKVFASRCSSWNEAWAHGRKARVMAIRQALRGLIRALHQPSGPRLPWKQTLKYFLPFPSVPIWTLRRLSEPSTQLTEVFGHRWRTNEQKVRFCPPASNMAMFWSTKARKTRHTQDGQASACLTDLMA